MDNLWIKILVAVTDASAKTTRIAAIVTLITFLLGLACSPILDKLEFREIEKSRRNGENNQNSGRTDNGK